MEMIETSHGSVCNRCLLWPDLCTCGPSWLRRFLEEYFGPLPKGDQA